MERRTEASRTLANPDGTFTVQSYAGPIHYTDAQGRWQPIDSTLVASSMAGYAWTNKANAFAVHLKNTLGAEAVAVKASGGTYTLTPLQLASVPGARSGARALYAGAATGTDVAYEVGPNRLKETITLRGATAPSTFAFEFKGPPGTKVTLAGDGSLVVADRAGARVFSFDAPWAMDAQPPGTGATVGAGERHASLSALAIAGGYKLVLSLDDVWLKNPARAFPVSVDPTITFKPNTRQGEAQSDNPDSVYGANLMSVGTSSVAAKRAAVAFDTTAIPAGSSVSASTMSLYYDLCVTPYACDVNNHLLELHRITGAWVTEGVTWNWLAANHDPVTAASTWRYAPAKSGWVSWGVAGLAQGWVNAPATNNGVMVRVADEALYRSGPCFSSAVAADPNLRPQLSVTYTPPPAVPDQLSPPDATRFTTVPTLSARYANASGAAGQVRFSLRNAAGVEVASGLSASVASGATGSWTPPALPDATYTWVAQALSGGAFSAWTAPRDVALAKAPAASPGPGEQRFATFETVSLNDRMHAHVNVANGNAVVHTHDLGIAGTGLDLALDRSYNSLSADASYDLGAGWVMGTGRDVGLSAFPDGAQLFEGPSGFRIRFAKNADGTYSAPTAIDATLVRNADASFTLSFDHSSEKLTFTSGGYLSAEADKNGNRIALSYDDTSRLTSITDTQGRATTLAYNGSGLITSATDPSGRVVSYGYDGAANLTAVTDAAGKVTTYAYDGAHRLVQVSDPLGNGTRLAYDTAGRVTSLVRITNPSAGTGPTTTFAYGTGSTVVTDARSNATTYTYDTLGRVTQVLDAAGNATAATYTANSNVASTTDAVGAPTNYAYDTKDNLTTATSATGAADNWGYTNTAHPHYATSHTNGQGNSTAYTYDGPGNLTTAENGLPSGQNQTRTAYNANGTVNTITDARGNVTNHGYDALGNLTSLTPPLGVDAHTYTYDAVSRVTTDIDAAGRTTNITYDTMDRMTKLAFADGTAVIFVYDANGNLTRRDDTGAAGLVTTTAAFAYDALARPTSKTIAGVSVTATYDDVGNLTSLSDPGGSVTYGYNNLNLLTTLTEPGAKVTTFGYDAAYRRTRTTYPNGVTQTIGYDRSGRQTSISAKDDAGATLTDFTYAYTNPLTGGDTSLRYHATNSGAAADYTYDLVDRLTRAQVGGQGTFTYAYDPTGNRTSSALNGGAPTTYAYDAANRMTSAGATTYTYDARGNQTANSAGQSLTYNAKNQTTAIKAPGALTAVNMTYAGVGQDERTKAASTAFTTGLVGLAIADTGALGTKTYYTRDASGELVGQRAGTTNSYYLFDGLGSVVAVTDATGRVVNRYSYDPYGKVTSTTEAVANPWRYAGGYFDAGTGLTKFGTRYYDPALGRWTQPDSAGSPGNYLYVGDDPVNFVDPSGLERQQDLSQEEMEAERLKKAGHPYAQGA